MQEIVHEPIDISDAPDIKHNRLLFAERALNQRMLAKHQGKSQVE